MTHQKKVAFFSTMMPTPTNVGGPSALPYQLTTYRPDNIELEIFTLNSNHISKELIAEYSAIMRCPVKSLEPNSFYSLCKKSRILQYLVSSVKCMPIQTTLKLRNSLAKLVNSDFDYAWIYPHYLIGIGNQIKLPTVVTGPDSSALDHHRCLKDEGSIRLLGKQRIRRFEKWALHLESEWAKKKNVNLHFVGKEDCNYYLLQNPEGNAFFLRHPSNLESGLAQKEYILSENPIKVIITGKLNRTTLTDSEIIISQLCQNASSLKDKYEFTFLGNGWDNYITMLKTNGYKVKSKKWVENYFDELKTHDIQLFPISTGVGTKGKVLDALCSGIVCLGSVYAFENINLTDTYSAFCYNNPYDIVEKLEKIFKDRKRFPEIAHNGFLVVEEEHSQKKVSHAFFNSLLNTPHL